FVNAGAHHDAVDRLKQFVVGEGFYKILFSANLDGFNRTLYRRETSNYQHAYAVVVIRNVPDQVDAALPRHLEICNDQVDFNGLQYRHTVGYVMGGINLVANAFEVTFDQFNRLFGVVDNEYAMFFRFLAHSAFNFLVRSRTGINTSKREPLPGALVTLMRPPWAETMPSTTDRPRPVPCPTGLVV